MSHLARASWWFSFQAKVYLKDKRNILTWEMVMKSIPLTISEENCKKMGEQFIFPTHATSYTIRLVTWGDSALGVLLLSLPLHFHFLSSPIFSHSLLHSSFIQFWMLVLFFIYFRSSPSLKSGAFFMYIIYTISAWFSFEDCICKSASILADSAVQ